MKNDTFLQEAVACVIEYNIPIDTISREGKIDGKTIKMILSGEKRRWQKGTREKFMATVQKIVYERKAEANKIRLIKYEVGKESNEPEQATDSSNT